MVIQCGWNYNKAWRKCFENRDDFIKENRRFIAPIIKYTQSVYNKNMTAIKKLVFIEHLFYTINLHARLSSMSN